MKQETKAALRDRQAKIDRHVSNLGQSNARRYLERQESKPRLREELLATLAFLGTAIVVLIVLLAL